MNDKIGIQKIRNKERELFFSSESPGKSCVKPPLRLSTPIAQRQPTTSTVIHNYLHQGSKFWESSKMISYINESEDSEVNTRRSEPCQTGQPSLKPLPITENKDLILLSPSGAPDSIDSETLTSVANYTESALKDFNKNSFRSTRDQSWSGSSVNMDRLKHEAKGSMPAEDNAIEKKPEDFTKRNDNNFECFSMEPEVIHSSTFYNELSKKNTLSEYLMRAESMLAEVYFDEASQKNPLSSVRSQQLKEFLTPKIEQLRESLKVPSLSLAENNPKVWAKKALHCLRFKPPLNYTRTEPLKTVPGWFPENYTEAFRNDRDGKNVHSSSHNAPILPPVSIRQLAQVKQRSAQISPRATPLSTADGERWRNANSKSLENLQFFPPAHKKNDIHTPGSKLDYEKKSLRKAIVSGAAREAWETSPHTNKESLTRSRKHRDQQKRYSRMVVGKRYPQKIHCRLGDSDGIHRGKICQNSWEAESTSDSSLSKENFLQRQNANLNTEIDIESTFGAIGNIGAFNAESHGDDASRKLSIFSHGDEFSSPKWIEKKSQNSIISNNVSKKCEGDPKCLCLASSASCSCSASQSKFQHDFKITELAFEPCSMESFYSHNFGRRKLDTHRVTPRRQKRRPASIQSCCKRSDLAISSQPLAAAPKCDSVTTLGSIHAIFLGYWGFVYPVFDMYSTF